MTAAHATCDRCGHIKTTMAELTVRRCLDNGAASYRFRCPVCEMTIVRDIEPRVMHLLVQSGARVEEWRLPTELFERPRGDVAPISVDDLIDFHEAIDGLPTAGRGV